MRDKTGQVAMAMRAAVCDVTRPWKVMRAREGQRLRPVASRIDVRMDLFESGQSNAGLTPKIV